MNLCQQFRLVRDIHGHVLAPDHVETIVFEGKLKRIALMELGIARKPTSVGKHPGHLDEFLGQINTSDVAADGLGEVSCGTANAATDVEDAHLR